ncbi:hypothetical protein [Maritalea mediterranea]|uniref:LPS export ABC transporter periplasmic protein LptC n=1 Tax=Maritalea mediterranea TaxID=2909667 RepID=A0ABS9E5Q7_9HYPH|nr:hypothetical protein [Maritalea mediterranea]MCF4097244.1 hypothetical protein [Maritalea mediterranea]
MTNLAAAPSFEQQFARVQRRRRVVKLLRLAIPGFGGMIFLALMVPLVIGNFLPTAQFEGIRLEEDNLVVDAPRATGTLSDGSTYEITAKSASTKIVNQDIIDLIDLTARIEFTDGENLVGQSANGAYSLITDILTLPTQIDLQSSKGDLGTIGSGVAQLNDQIFDGDDGVAFDFANGTILRAINMHYDGAKQYWKFERANLTIPPQSELSDEN